MKRIIAILLCGMMLMPWGILPVDDGVSVGMSMHAQKAKTRKKGKTKGSTKTKSGKSGKKQTSQPLTAEEARRRQQQAREEIALTKEQIAANEKEVKENLSTLGTLQADINENKAKVNSLQKKVDKSTSDIAALEAQIAKQQANLETMRKQYGNAIKKMRMQRGKKSDLAFLFSSKSFYQAWRRMRYLREFGEWRKAKSEEIKGIVAKLDYETKLLDQTRSEQSRLLAAQQATQSQLETQYGKQNEIVEKLKGQGATLKRHLTQKQTEVNNLNSRIAELIAAEEKARLKKEAEAKAAAERKAAEEAAKKEEEARKASEAESQPKEQKETKKEEKKETPKADKKKEEKKKAETKTKTETKTKEEKKEKSYAEARKREPRSQEKTAAAASSFAASKGKLPKPSSGTFRITGHYGRQNFAGLEDVEFVNTGIDAEVSAGSSAVAVYDGKVSGVYKLDGFSTVVIVSHDGYYTVYGNLESSTVAAGQTIRQGQSLGKVGKDPDSGNGHKLHFEVWKNREKQDPEQWLR